MLTSLKEQRKVLKSETEVLLKSIRLQQAEDKQKERKNRQLYLNQLREETQQTRIKNQSFIEDIAAIESEKREQFIKNLKKSVAEFRTNFTAQHQKNAIKNQKERLTQVKQLKNDTIQFLIDFVLQHKETSIEGYQKRHEALQNIRAEVNDILERSPQQFSKKIKK